ncbi:MAG: Uma2 family endonuclease [Vulcanimicrobiaceae bacterium]
MREIILSEAKPAFEWIGGRAVQKVSPKRRHAILQAAITSTLRAWATGKGEVGSEWRFRLAPPGEVRRPLVPDVAFLSNERRRGLTGEDRETPPVAPDIVVEILSPDDRRADINEKCRVYVATGVRLVLYVDPETRRIDAYRPDGTHEKISVAGTYEPREFPNLALPFGDFFAELDRE